jgi:CheY-like chemotaxis protein
VEALKMNSSDSPNQTAGLLLSDDMIFTSRITHTARDLGVRIVAARQSPAILELARLNGPSCVLIDLANPGLELNDFIQQIRLACTPTPRLIAYGSHVDAEGLKRARTAGCDVVLARSKFVEELPRNLHEWIKAKTEGESGSDA